MFTYNLRRSKNGLSIEGSWKYNLPNKANYQIGQRTTLAVRYFYWEQFRQISLVPSAGFQWEHAALDFDNGEENSLSGGNMILARAGMDFFYKRYGAGVEASIPARQNLSGGQVKQIFRMQLSGFFSF